MQTTDTSAATQEPKLWPPSGRLGRARLIAYSIGGQLLIFLVIGALAAIGGAAWAPLLFLVYLVFNVTLLIQRSHDLDLSGWWTIAAHIPLVGLYWLFAPGTKGPNRFGPPPTPNSTAVVVVACLMALVVPGVGILAAVALPAYQDYTVRAKLADAIVAQADCRDRVARAYQQPIASPGADVWQCTSGSGTSRYVGAAQTDANGAILLTLQNTGTAAIDGHRLALVPVGENGRPLTARDAPAKVARFRCMIPPGDGVPERMLPGSCR